MLSSDFTLFYGGQLLYVEIDWQKLEIMASQHL